MLIIIQSNNYHEGALCRVIGETPKRYQIEFISHKGREYQTATIHTTNAVSVDKRNVIAENVSEGQYEEYVKIYKQYDAELEALTQQNRQNKQEAINRILGITEVVG